MSPVKHSRVWAALALAFFSVHAAVLLAAGSWWDTLWMCHLASLALAAGWLLRNRAAIGIGMLWLLAGVPLWIMNVITTGELMPTSLLTHIGGLVVAVVGVRTFGWPTGVWWKSWALFVGLQQLTRWITPPAANVNVAFAIWPGWEVYFSSFFAYSVSLLASGAVFAFVVEFLLLRIRRSSSKQTLGRP